RYVLVVLGMSVALVSCSSRAMVHQGELYIGGSKTDSGMALLKLVQPTVEVVEHATLDHRSYHPSAEQHVWITNIDGQPVSKFLEKDQDPRMIKKYHLLPGKHEIAVMFEGSGTSVRFIHMFEDSVKMNFEYHCITKEPVVFELDIPAEARFTVRAHAAQNKCDFSVTHNDRVVAENAGRLRYTYSNIWDPKNWYLNQENLHQASH
ncbi:MAG: hypothetical protein ACE5IY_19255, partial [bacterium]